MGAEYRPTGVLEHARQGHAWQPPQGSRATGLLNDDWWGHAWPHPGNVQRWRSTPGGLWFASDSHDPATYKALMWKTT
jgi:hypothetical protein